jgi:large subunit ribosomal protein L25
MADVAAIQAERRSGAGKGAARALRRDGRVPGVVYGGDEDALAISLETARITQEHERGGFFSRLYSLDLDGSSLRVLAREVQLHPVTSAVLHVDFLRLRNDSEVRVDVPVEFLNEDTSPGVKRGGVLNIVRRTVELICQADSIPLVIEADIGELEIGDSVKISAIDLPGGVRPGITDRDFTIATVAAPTVMVEEVTGGASEEGEEDEALEGEVSGSGAEGGDAQTSPSDGDSN